MVTVSPPSVEALPDGSWPVTTGTVFMSAPSPPVVSVTGVWMSPSPRPPQVHSGRSVSSLPRLSFHTVILATGLLVLTEGSTAGAVARISVSEMTSKELP